VTVELGEFQPQKISLKIGWLSEHSSNLCADNLYTKPEIHQALLSQLSLLTEFFIGKILVKERDSRVSTLVNLNPD
jgi:hypothetical protein